MDAADAVDAWRKFASTIRVLAADGTTSITWVKYLDTYTNGRTDERTTVGPTVFPAFAEQVLGFKMGATLAAENPGSEGRPDFTPADAVTHPFVFEVKGTDGRHALAGHDSQVSKYLTEGHARIHRVVLTNLYGLRVFKLDTRGNLNEVESINLRGLALMPRSYAIADINAQKLADFINNYHWKELTRDQKIERIRQAPEWNPGLEVTSSDWVLVRLDSVVESLRANVALQVSSGALFETTILPTGDRALVERELRELEKRVGTKDADAETHTLSQYAGASRNTNMGLALQQFIAHTAFYTATRLLLVRAWEDSGLLVPAALYDGGFDKLMRAMAEVVSEVVEHAFSKAGVKYPDLFRRHNAFSWFTPDENEYVDALYDLANTYLGDLSDDILGEVYQRQLARVDRKQLGQYYTPRDIIGLIWDLINIEPLVARAEAEDRGVRVLDVATGSGGFLVSGVARQRHRWQEQDGDGTAVPLKQWLTEITAGSIGCEIQQFSAYLAEVNLVLQLSPLLKSDPALKLPALRVHCADTLTLHNPEDLMDGVSVAVGDAAGLEDATDIEERQDSLDRLRDLDSSGEWLDVAIGNPPYVGESLIAATVRDLQARHPYWRQFAANHADYLYLFLILGISKLRKGGRFGFITTEYWLKATGAAPLRKFLSEHVRIERLVVFREFTLFPDAPGQHNLIIIGERVTDPTSKSKGGKLGGKPKVAIYTGGRKPADRAKTIGVIRRGDARGANGAELVMFGSLRDPNALGAGSWAETIMTAEQLARRRAVQSYTDKAAMLMSEGVLTPPQRLRGDDSTHLPAATIAVIGGPGVRAGVFELTAAEKDALEAAGGGFTQKERDHLLPLINTKDIYPYGVVLPAAPNHLVWMPRTHGGKRGGFPANMPTIEAHLKMFKPLLEVKVEGYNEDRPWWSTHRPRVELLDGHTDTGGWADLAVMNRWGDNKLVAGLAPAHSVSLSGLHVFTGEAAMSLL